MNNTTDNQNGILKKYLSSPEQDKGQWRNKKKNREQKNKKQKNNNKTADINSEMSIITLNLKGLNTSIKRQRLAE